MYTSILINLIKYFHLKLTVEREKGPHHSMKNFIYKQDVSPLKPCSIISYKGIGIKLKTNYL